MAVKVDLAEDVVVVSEVEEEEEDDLQILDKEILILWIIQEQGGHLEVEEEEE